MKRPGYTGLALLSMIALLGGCTSSEEDAKSKAEKAASAKEPPAPPPKPLDHTLVPGEVLADLEALDLKSEAPCSLAIDSLKPALGGLATLRKALESATDTTAAVTLLSDAATALRKQIQEIPARTESDELRRLRAEMVATLGDLGKGLETASKALAAEDRAAADANQLRIKNGVQNTRSTIHALIQQCVYP